MKHISTHFKNFIPCTISVIIAMCSVIPTHGANAASVASRGTPARAKVTAAARIPTAKAPTTTASTTPEPQQQQSQPEPISAPEVFEFENRTGMFDSAINASGTSASGATSDSELAEMIRRQRDALNASDSASLSQNTATASIVSGQNACDSGLRKCMQSKCGPDFTKCSGDTDTTWGDKMDACRRDTECTGHEYQLFSNEIKADRDVNAQLANYNRIIDCGNRYNNCIINECGTTYSKCLGKSEGDLAISKCKKIQTECTQMDNGLASRTMNVFGTLRQDAEKQIQRDEQRLYDLRDEMERTCRSLGAMFDQRSLDCVYTINFFAANNPTPYATKKAYAGGTFDCDPGWFGIDITTFKENAYRETIAQKSASAAMLGSGVGMAAGAITSGAIDRALATQKAEKAVKEAEQGDKKTDKKAEREAKKEEKQAEKDAKKAEKQAEKNAKKEAKDAKKTEKQAEKDTKKEDKDTKETKNKDNKSEIDEAMCTAVGGKLTLTKRCQCTNSSGKTITTKNIDECVAPTTEEESIDDEDDINTTQIVCEDLDGTYENNQCKCKNAQGHNITTKNPVMDCVKPSDDSGQNDSDDSDDSEDDDKNDNADQN